MPVPLATKLTWLGTISPSLAGRSKGSHVIGVCAPAGMLARSPSISPRIGPHALLSTVTLTAADEHESSFEQTEFRRATTVGQSVSVSAASLRKNVSWLTPYICSLAKAASFAAAFRRSPQ